MTTRGVEGVPSGLSGLRPLLGERMDLERVRTPDPPDGLAAHGFRRAWAALIAGVEPEALALRETALALVAVRLGGIDAKVPRRLSAAVAPRG
ncbi:hypothetical protein [Pyxidicoccus fallax]|uniref:hypothetical protein n=1 Tax=Pyxidicoccus fallax TaxID=394095 RepID=UPI001FE2FEB0|nr:hypothetical protein [Pyxidicoccus fallax]